MYDITTQVQRWFADGRAVQVAQVVETKGFSSRDPGAALAWADGESAGSLVPVIDRQLIRTQDGGRLIEVAVSDEDAVAVGLSCGGRASVLVQPVSAYPAELWERLAAREPVCLVTEVRDGQPGQTAVFGPRDVRGATQFAGGQDVPRLFGRGVTGTQVVPVEGGGALVVVALWPPTNLVVVGDGSIAEALRASGALLGWAVDVRPQPDLSALAALTESDAVVVLSHDRSVDVPALEAALSGRCGYVGGLGSRHTQHARREGLTERGVSAAEQARIFGPAGLDIDAHTPAEIAVSIVAEILAHRSGASGGSLRERGGPVHTGGVSAPPPRYAD
jgi:xanthine dehydrogenase accessory factor